MSLSLIPASEMGKINTHVTDEANKSFEMVTMFRETAGPEVMCTKGPAPTNGSGCYRYFALAWGQMTPLPCQGLSYQVSDTFVFL